MFLNAAYSDRRRSAGSRIPQSTCDDDLGQCILVPLFSGGTLKTAELRRVDRAAADWMAPGAEGEHDGRELLGWGVNVSSGTEPFLAN